MYTTSAGKGSVELVQGLLMDSVLGDQKVVTISCGSKHSVVLTQNGKVLSWGAGEMGQLGHGTPLVRACVRSCVARGARHCTASVAVCVGARVRGSAWSACVPQATGVSVRVACSGFLVEQTLSVCSPPPPFSPLPLPGV